MLRTHQSVVIWAQAWWKWDRQFAKTEKKKMALLELVNCSQLAHQNELLEDDDWLDEWVAAEAEGSGEHLL